MNIPLKRSSTSNKDAFLRRPFVIKQCYKSFTFSHLGDPKYIDAILKNSAFHHLILLSGSLAKIILTSFGFNFLRLNKARTLLQPF